MSAHVLIVDREPVVRDVLVAWLTDEGYRCVAAGDAAEALTRGAVRSFDVALVDWMLSDEGGARLGRELRNTHRDMALIVVTNTQIDALQATDLEITEQLYKPFTRQQLIDTVGCAVRWRATRKLSDGWRDLDQRLTARAMELAQVFVEADTASTSALRALITQVHRSNPEAALHAQRVARMAVAIGTWLRLPTADLDLVEQGALLHDVGKAALPDAIIAKPNPLTDEEIAIIRTHPQVGFAMVSAVPALRRPAELVLASHEAWDGSGYPRHLAGSAIPLGARITAVADTFDALTWSRVYREPVSQVRAAAELVRCAGTQIDPAVVHAWLRLMDLEQPPRVNGPGGRGRRRILQLAC